MQCVPGLLVYVVPEAPSEVVNIGSPVQLLQQYSLVGECKQAPPAFAAAPGSPAQLQPASRAGECKPPHCGRGSGGQKSGRVQNSGRWQDKQHGQGQAAQPGRRSRGPWQGKQQMQGAEEDPPEAGDWVEERRGRAGAADGQQRDKRQGIAVPVLASAEKALLSDKGQQQGKQEGRAAPVRARQERRLLAAKDPKFYQDARAQDHTFDELRDWLCSNGVKDPTDWSPLAVGVREYAMKKYLRGRIWLYSQDPAGTRVVQGALGLPIPESRRLVLELRGHVLEAIASAHANHVLAAVIQAFTFDALEFVVDAFEGLGFQLAVHPYGCRIMIRLVEHFHDNAKVLALVDGMLDPELAEVLCRSKYGHHVAESLFDVYGPGSLQTARLTQALEGKLREFAKKRHASYVVEKLLQVELGGGEEGAFRAHATELLGEDFEHVDDLLEHHFSCFVLLSLLGMSQVMSREVTFRLQQTDKRSERQEEVLEVLQARGFGRDLQ